MKVWDSWFRCASACFQTKKKHENNHTISVKTLSSDSQVGGGWAQKSWFLHILHKPCLRLVVSRQLIAWCSGHIHLFYPGNRRKKTLYATHIFLLPHCGYNLFQYSSIRRLPAHCQKQFLLTQVEMHLQDANGHLWDAIISVLCGQDRQDTHCSMAILLSCFKHASLWKSPFNYTGLIKYKKLSTHYSDYFFKQ